jgi:hypothetical protein
MSETCHSLLPFTPDTMRDFQQDIMVDLNALTKISIARKVAAQMPAAMSMNVSFVAAFEALRLFREITRQGMEGYSDAEKSQLAEVEVEWCLDLLERLQADGKLEQE